MAGLAAMARGAGEPGTSAAACRVVTPGFMADLHGVNPASPPCSPQTPCVEMWVTVGKLQKGSSICRVRCRSRSPLALAQLRVIWPEYVTASLE